MKRLLPVLTGFALLLLSSTEGWSLPPCPGSPHTISDYKEVTSWSNCHGAITFGSGAGKRAGNKYVGEWKDGKLHGQGTETFASGSKYVGEYKDGIFHGQGTYTWADGDKYEGQWKDDNFHGHGTFTWADGDKYVGQWKNGKKHTSEYPIPCRRVGTSVTPANVTYGKKERTCKRDWKGYAEKESVTFEVVSGSPVYAITNMRLYRVKGLSSKERRGESPYDDIHLYFETDNGSTYEYYHMKSSYLTPTCPVWDKFEDSYGWDHTEECGANPGTPYGKGEKVTKGQLIGYSGATGNHGHFDIAFKPMINGRRHIVQGDRYFEWECGNEDPSKFHMPFECK